LAEIIGLPPQVRQLTSAMLTLHDDRQKASSLM